MSFQLVFYLEVCLLIWKKRIYLLYLTCEFLQQKQLKNLPHSKKGFTGKGFLFLAFREYKELATKIAADGNPVVSAQEEPSKALGHLSISANPYLSFQSHFGICDHLQTV